MLTPSRWNPRNYVYTFNEKIMLDYQGNMVAMNHRQTILLEDIDEYINIADVSHIGRVESKVVEKLRQRNNAEDDSIKSQFDTIPYDDNHVDSVITDIIPLLDDNTIYNKTSAENSRGKFQVAGGSTTATRDNYIIDDDNISIDSSNNSDYSDNDEDEFIIDDIY